MRWTARWTVAAVAAVLIIAAAVVLVVVRHGNGSGPAAGSVTARQEMIKVDGIELAAQVATPRGKGPFPLVVVPTSWGATVARFSLLGQTVAAHGFETVVYTQRGFHDSGGEVDFMGPRTQADVSAVISWALAHTPADRSRIGLMGSSYGAGASLLGAEHDPRVKAVVAMSTWTDFSFAFDPHGTLSTQILLELLDSTTAGQRLDPQLTRLAADLHGDPAAARAELARMSSVRSAMSHVGTLNRNGTAVMIANAWEDSIFSPDQLVRFYHALHTPKRLQLAAGDHGGPEQSALDGQPNTTVDDAIAWLQHYLDGTRSGTAGDDPIQLQDVTDLTWHGYRHWPASQTRVRLGRPGRSGNVGPSASPTWRASISTGADSGAESGPTLFQPSANYQVPAVPIPAIVSSRAFTWTGPTTTGPTRVAGAARLQLRVSSSAPSVSLFGYLYDVDPTGVGRLMSATPYTVAGLRDGAVRTVRIDLRPICWTVAAGHHLALVLDSVDGRFTAAAPPGSTLILSSTARDPASFQLPFAG